MACRTPSEQIYKILEMLPKRGPDAFQSFLEILQEQYEWLARLLQDSLVSEADRIQQEKMAAAVKKEEENAFTPRASNFISLDYDIKSRTSAFIQRQFGQVRRISNTDKKNMERWLGEWLQNERRQLTKAFDDANTAIGEIDVFQHQDLKQRVFALYLYIITKMKKPKKMIQVKHTEKDSDTEDEEKVNMEAVEREITSDDANFDLLWSEVDGMFEEMQGMKKEIDKSFDYLGHRNAERPLSFVVHDLCGEYRLREKELVKERKKIEEMLVELYNYSTDSNKMQHSIKTLEGDIVELREQINRLKQDNIDLIKEITTLEKARLGHIEKEKTLEQLRQTKEDLQTLIQVVNQENKELKQIIQSGKGAMKYGVRGFQNRKPLTSLNNSNGNKVQGTTTASNNQTRPGLKKSPAKKRSNSMRH